MKFKDIEDITGLPEIKENLLTNHVEETLVWYDGPLMFTSRYQGQEVFVYSVTDYTYKVYVLSPEAKEKMGSTSDLEGEYWDCLEEEECIGIWVW